MCICVCICVQMGMCVCVCVCVLHYLLSFKSCQCTRTYKFPVVLVKWNKKKVINCVYLVDIKVLCPELFCSMMSCRLLFN